LHHADATEAPPMTDEKMTLRALAEKAAAATFCAR
jgi:hypothetical protein